MKHLCNNGSTPHYTRWILHGEKERTRDEVVRQRFDVYNVNAGVGYMLNDYREVQMEEERMKEELEESAKAYHHMLSAAQHLVHGHTKVS